MSFDPFSFAGETTTWPLPRAIRRPSRAPAVCLSDDIEEVRAAAAAARARRRRILNEAAIADELLDQAASDRAWAEFEPVDNALYLIDRRLDELEEEAGWAELKEQRRDYWSRVL